MLCGACANTCDRSPPPGMSTASGQGSELVATLLCNKAKHVRAMQGQAHIHKLDTPTPAHILCAVPPCHQMWMLTWLWSTSQAPARSTQPVAASPGPTLTWCGRAASRSLWVPLVCAALDQSGLHTPSKTSATRLAMCCPMEMSSSRGARSERWQGPSAVCWLVAVHTLHGTC